MAPVGSSFFTNIGPVWVVTSLFVGQRVVANSGPTPDCDLHVGVVVGVEVGNGAVEGGTVRTDQT